MTNDSNNNPDAVEQAMNTVLQAERAAEQAISHCRQEAIQIVQTANERAQRITTRTDERLALCHMRCNGKISRELKNRQHAERLEAVSQPAQQLDDAVLSDMVSAVASELIGAAQPDGEDRDAS